jgi:superfamily II DNA or RNA helicase
MAFMYELNKLSKHERLAIKNDLFKTVYVNKKPTQISWPLTLTNGFVKLPIGWLNSKNIVLLSVDILKKSSKIILRDEQQLFLKKVLQQESPSIFSQAWNLKPGFGKTHTCLAAVEYYGIPCTIVVHRIGIKNSWLKIIHEMNMKDVQVLMVSEFTPEAATNMVVVDEAHACVTKNMLDKFTNIFPKILIGLSGTFYRYDEHHIFLEWLFGKPIELCNEGQNILQQTSSRTIRVLTIQTGIRPECKATPFGKLDWNRVLKSLAFNEERNNQIVELVHQYSDLNILILVRFIEHGLILKDLLKDLDVSLYFSNDKLCADSRIIISTTKKMGTGVSVDKLNCLILATDCERYSIQYISRVLRVKTQDALIIDFKDSHSSLVKHYESRIEVYKELGAIFMA